VERTRHFPYEVSETTAVKTKTVLDDAKALHAAHRGFHSYPASGVGLIRCLLLDAQVATTRLLEGRHHLNASTREGQQATVLEQAAALREVVIGEVRDALVCETALVRTAEVEHAQERIHEEEGFDRVEALVGAVVVGKRGGGRSSVACSWASACGSKRFISSATLRAGASPHARRALRRAASRLWSHIFALPWRIPYRRPWEGCVGFSLR
jgi:hypothetical protein